MLKLLIGKKGTGKTKILIDGVNAASAEAHGNVVFISNDTSRNMYDIKSKVRMFDASEFKIASCQEFLGFIKGIISGNFDITNIYIDGILKIVKEDVSEDFLASVEELGSKYNIDITVSVSIDADEAPEYIKKYC